MKDAKKRFLIVDDDPQNNTISKMVLRKVLGEVEIKDFVIPESGLEYIESEFISNGKNVKTTLLLDINMPTMSGWEFLEKFETFTDTLKQQYSIYILSSSVDPVDVERAKLNPLVIDFIEKPLKKETLSKLFM